MTMPHERMRALCWGFELLELAQDGSLPEPLRSTAAGLLPSYPRPQALEQALADGRTGLEPACLEALNNALERFRAVRVGGQGSEETRHAPFYTLRHYPERWEIQALGCAGRLSDWIDLPR